MGDRYAATGAQDVTTATPGDTSLSIQGQTTTRSAVYDFIITTGGTPADNAIVWLVQRHTEDGTNTGVTPAELDLAGPASLVTAGENHTIEPTYTASGELFHQIINQRATFRWVAAPGGELKNGASTTEGIGWVAFHASYTGSAEATAHWYE